MTIRMADAMTVTQDIPTDQTKRALTEVYIETTIAKGLWVYGAPLLIILGTIGNTLSLITLTRKNMRKSTSSVYLSVLAVVDTTVLYTGLLRQWLIRLSDTDVRKFTMVGCKVHVFLVYYTLHLSAWILVVVTFERLIAVYRPHKLRAYCTQFTTLITLCVVFGILFFVNLHFFWTRGKLVINSDGKEGIKCVPPNEEYEHFDLYTWTWIDTCIASFVPFIIMFVSNVLIIGKVRKLSSTNESKMTNMTAMLLTVNFVFIICTMPIVILLNFKTTWYPGKVGHTKAKFDLHYAISTLLMYTNSAVNFLLYCVSGPRFRQELSRLWCKKNQIIPSSTTNSNTNDGIDT